MISKCKETIEKYNMICGDDKVFVAISGGADSVCLLLVLEEIQKEMGFGLEAIHVEHGIRGEESLEDARFVEDLCKKHGIKLHSYSGDSNKIAKEEGLSLEEAARKLRYDCFHNHINDGKIATAHHMEDNAETMLFNMVRGSGIEGVRGIKKVRGNFIRPLIECNRKEIEEYLSDKNQDYCTDSTNEETDYTRNNIRHNIIPKLLEINSGAIEHLSNLSKMQDMAVDYIRKQGEEVYKKYVEGNKLSKQLLNEELIILQFVSHRFLCHMAGSSKDISNIHVDEIVDLIKGNSGRKVNLPYGLVAVSNYDSIEINRDSLKDSLNSVYEEIVLDESHKKKIISVNNVTVKLEVVSNTKNIQIAPKTYTKMFDYDKITEVICLRNRREKDYIIINHKGSKKSLNRYMIDEKIPSQHRDSVLLLCDGNHVMYVVGHRISEYYKVNDETRRILKVQITGENINE